MTAEPNVFGSMELYRVWQFVSSLTGHWICLYQSGGGSVKTYAISGLRFESGDALPLYADGSEGEYYTYSLVLNEIYEHSAPVYNIYEKLILCLVARCKVLVSLAVWQWTPTLREYGRLGYVLGPQVFAQSPSNPLLHESQPRPVPHTPVPSLHVQQHNAGRDVIDTRQSTKTG